MGKEWLLEGCVLTLSEVLLSPWGLGLGWGVFLDCNILARGAYENYQEERGLD